MTAEPIIRHYRGATRSDVEQAYRSEAALAAEAGYMPATHQWTTDPQGFLLAVTYRRAGGSGSDAPAEPAPAATDAQAPAEEVEARAVSEQMEPVGDQFEPYQRQVDHDAGAEFEAAPRADAATYEPAPTRDEMYERAADEQPAQEQAAAETAAEQPAFDQPAFEQPTFEQPADEMAEETGDEQLTDPQQAYDQSPYGQIATDPDVTDEDAPSAEAAPEQVAEDQSDEPAYEPVDYPAAPPVELVIPSEMPVADDTLYGQLAPEPLVATEPEPELSGTSSDAQPAPSSIGRNSRLTIQTMEMHCAGEPLRIIRSGFPEVPNLPVLERRAWVAENADHVRQSIIQEPRGHKDMYGAILLPPHGEHADMTVLFMHNEGYSTMCGHGVIAITTGLIEEGLFPATEPVTTIRYEVPAGIVTANAATVQLENGDWAVQGVRFTNVPSYLAEQSNIVRPEGVELHGAAADYGALSVDMAFGGAYYGIVNAADLGLRVVPDQAEALRRAGAAITDVLRRDHTPSHPTDGDLSFVYGTIIVDYDPRTSPDGRATHAHIRNATIFADAELDRSPCGSGTSAILAQLHARGRIRIGQELINAGITGEHFLGRVEAETALGSFPAVSTSVAGTAFITGYSTFIVDNRDPLGDGFLLR